MNKGLFRLEKAFIHLHSIIIEPDDIQLIIGL